MSTAVTFAHTSHSTGFVHHSSQISNVQPSITQSSSCATMKHNGYPARGCAEHSNAPSYLSMFSLVRATWRGALAISDMSQSNCDRMESRWDLYPLIWRIQKQRQRCRRRLLKSATSQCERICAWACASARLPLHSSLFFWTKLRASLQQWQSLNCAMACHCWTTVTKRESGTVKRNQKQNKTPPHTQPNTTTSPWPIGVKRWNKLRLSRLSTIPGSHHVFSRKYSRSNAV